MRWLRSLDAMMAMPNNNIRSGCLGRRASCRGRVRRGQHGSRPTLSSLVTSATPGHPKGSCSGGSTWIPHTDSENKIAGDCTARGALATSSPSICNSAFGLLSSVGLHLVFPPSATPSRPPPVDVPLPPPQDSSTVCLPPHIL
jgi:hypothetical protein